MKNGNKRMLALLLALVLIFSAVPVPAMATTVETGNSVDMPSVHTHQEHSSLYTTGSDYTPDTEQNNYVPMVLGENTANITEVGGYAYFSFTPEEAGTYSFYSVSGMDTYADLYDSNMNWLSGDDDSGADWNFSFTYPMTAGETYILKVRYYGDAVGSFTVMVDRAVELVSLSFAPLTIIEGTCGEYRTHTDGYTSGTDAETAEKYYYYEPYEFLRKAICTATFADGAIVTGTDGYITYKGQSYCYYNRYELEQGYGAQWTAGNTYVVYSEISGIRAEIEVTISRKTEDNGYTYLVQNGKAIINGCTMKTEILQIPETIDGYPVVGVTSLTEGVKYAKEVRIPDSVTMLSSDFLYENEYGNQTPLKKLVLGSGIRSVDMSMLYGAREVEYIEVSKNNPYLCSIDGVVYNKDVTKLLLYPVGKEEVHRIPDTVTDISVLMGESWWLLDGEFNFIPGAGIADYKVVDGVIYNADMSEIIRATADATGSYVIPDSVTTIGGFAFKGSNLTEITWGVNVTNTTYTSFTGADKLKEITIPSNIEFIAGGGFPENLERVNISDLAAWCNIRFWENPLAQAHNLYLNGEKIVDLVIPESCVEINDGAFMGGSFESVSIPANVKHIGYDAFYKCENLKKVYITDMGAWSGTEFITPQSNPLYYAHDLYLNGKLVTDLVLTETVADRVYDFVEELGVNDYAFYNASIESVTVPKGIELLDDEAFAGCENLTKVYISDLAAWASIDFRGAKANPLYYAKNLYLNGEKVVDLVFDKSTDITNDISDYAFYNINIESLTVPDYVYSIGSYSFYGSAVESIAFEDGNLQHIGESAFETSNVKTLDLPDSLKSIDYAAFRDCQDLQTVNFGSGVERISSVAFQGSGITSVILPDSLQTLGTEAFRDCQNLQSVTFGNSLEVIPYKCFYNTGLKKVTLPKQIKTVESSAFANSALTDVIFNCDRVTVYDGAFANCPIGDLELGSNVVVEGWEAFSGINAAQIKLHSGVTEITYREFAFNKNLVAVTIPDTVEYISDAAFEGDYYLSHVLFTGTEEQWKELGTESFELQNATLHCEATGDEVTVSHTCTTVTYSCSICNKEETLRKAEATHTFDDNQICTICGHEGYWEYAVDEDKGTVTITGYTGRDTQVVVPAKIENLPVTAFTLDVFEYNRTVTSVVLPDTITEIPDDAFFCCSSLSTVDVGTGITSVGDRAFYWCSSLKSLYLPDSVTSIGDFAFDHCELSDFTLPKKLTNIGFAAFHSCLFKSVEIPAGVEEIGGAAFENCWYLVEVKLPDTVTSIGYHAFTGARIKELVVPASVKTISPFAFVENGMETLVFLGDKPEMDDAFDTSGISVFYPAANETWSDLPEDDNSWYPCSVPEITKQPVNTLVDIGQKVTLSVEAYGHRLSYQWYFAEPCATTYKPIGGDSIELTLTMDEITSRSRVYCVVTDILGQTTKTKTIALDRISGSVPAPVAHTYTNGCDTECNVCGETREAVHDYAKATCTAPKTCKNCGATSGSKLDHDYKAATCTAPKTCKNCGATSGSKLGHDYKAATCTAPKTCKVCGATSGKALGHTYTNDCDASCNRCSAKRSVKHKYTNDCDTSCNVCKAKRAALHKYTNSCDTTCNLCKAKRTIKHTYSNGCDTTCNVCKAKRTISHTYKTVTTKATLTKNGKVEKKCSECGKVSSSTTVKYAKTIKLSATSYTYDGKVKTPTVTVKDSAGKTLKKNTDYTVSYASGRKNVGTYKVTITFKGKYSGTKVLTFKINPKAASVNKLTAKTKGLTVKLNRQTVQSTGYEIQYATSKTFKSAKTTTASYSTSTKSISGLKAKTTYYVRVRTYKTVSGVKYYSNWSTAKYMKTK